MLKKSNYNAKVSEIEGKMPSISGLVTTSASTAIENKISSLSNLVKKTDYDTKNSKLEKKVTNHNHDNYITTPEFNNSRKFCCKISTSKFNNKNRF